MHDLLDEARRMPDAAIRFPRDVSEVRTPAHLVRLRERVRQQHVAQLVELHRAIDERFGTTGARDDFVNVFYAASEMALMANVAGDELPASDRSLLRQLWTDLLNA